MRPHLYPNYRRGAQRIYLPTCCRRSSRTLGNLQTKPSLSALPHWGIQALPAERSIHAKSAMAPQALLQFVKILGENNRLIVLFVMGRVKQDYVALFGQCGELGNRLRVFFQFLAIATPERRET